MKIYPGKKFIHIPSGKMYRVLNGKVDMHISRGEYIGSDFSFTDLFDKNLFRPV